MMEHARARSNRRPSETFGLYSIRACPIRGQAESRHVRIDPRHCATYALATGNVRTTVGEELALRLSKYNFIVRDGDAYLAYNALRNGLARITAETYGQLQEIGRHASPRWMLQS